MRRRALTLLIAQQCQSGSRWRSLFQLWLEPTVCRGGEGEPQQCCLDSCLSSSPALPSQSLAFSIIPGPQLQGPAPQFCSGPALFILPQDCPWFLPHSSVNPSNFSLCSLPSSPTREREGWTGGCDPVRC